MFRVVLNKDVTAAKKLDKTLPLKAIRNVLSKDIEGKFAFEGVSSDEEDITLEKYLEGRGGGKIINITCGQINVQNGGKVIAQLTCFKTSTLDEMRARISSIIIEPFSFLSEGAKVMTRDEKDVTVEDIAQDMSILIMTDSSHKQTAPLCTASRKSTPVPYAEKIERKGMLDIYLLPNVEFTDEEKRNAKVIMVVGETGSGKTTLLNSYVNYLMGVQYVDDFRYTIIDERAIMESLNGGESVTHDVTIYRIKGNGNNPPVVVVDTPGFGDTMGIDQDKIVMDKISHTFEDDLTCIDAVCFVAQSSNARLTVSQRYIFSSVLNLFGNDVAENFVMMLTFCDGSTPPIIPCLQSDGSVVKNVITQISGDWYFKFNNSAVFEKEQGRDNNFFWDYAMESFQRFTEKVMRLPRKSLCLSKEVLQQRKTLENNIARLQADLDRFLVKYNQLTNQLDMVKSCEAEINSSKDFEYWDEEIQVVKQCFTDGRKTTFCLECNYTCHDNCSECDETVDSCFAMKNGYCTCCPGRCHWSMHKNLPFFFTYETRRVKRTKEDLKRQYYEATSNKSFAQQCVEGTQREMSLIIAKCLEIQEQAKRSIELLERIALNPSTYKDSEEFVDLLIQSEESQKNEGYLKRIQSLRVLKQQHALIRKVYEQEKPGDMTYEQFVKQYVEGQKGGLVEELKR